MKLFRFAFLILLSLSVWHLPQVTVAQVPTPTLAEVKIDPKIFDGYVGQYEDAANLGGTIFSFFREGDKFYGQVTNQDKFEIYPLSETKFFLKITQAEVEFVRDASGKATSIICDKAAESIWAKKSPTNPPKTRAFRSNEPKR